MKCLQCGTEFEPHSWNRKFCSAKCGNKYRYKPKTTPRVYNNTCAVCGKTFEARSSATKYCSPECYRRRNPSKYKSKATRQATCPICGAQFGASQPNQIYCSRLCCKAAERKRKKLARRGMSRVEFLPAEPAIEIAPPREPQPAPIDEIFPPHVPREVIIPAAVAENRKPTIDELLDWIFSEERSA